MHVGTRSRHSEKKIGQTRIVFAMHVERHSFDDLGEDGEIDFGGFTLNETSLHKEWGFVKKVMGVVIYKNAVKFKISR